MACDIILEIQPITSFELEIQNFSVNFISSATNFLELTDTPATYVGQANKLVKVKSDQTGLEFVTSSATFSGVSSEVPIGVLDGINATFTSSIPFDGSHLKVYRNGQRLKVIEDYTIMNSSTFVFNVAPFSDDTLLIDYIPL